MRLTKRDGAHEEFSRSKAEQALRRIGVPEQVINGTLERVVPSDGESTTSYRDRIAAELRLQGSEMAPRFQHSRRLAAGRSESAPEGTAVVNPDTIRFYGWTPGERIKVQHGNTVLSVHLDESTQSDARVASFNPRTLRSLGAPDGTRVILFQSR